MNTHQTLNASNSLYYDDCPHRLPCGICQIMKSQCLKAYYSTITTYGSDSATSGKVTVSYTDASDSAGIYPAGYHPGGEDATD